MEVLSLLMNKNVIIGLIILSLVAGTGIYIKILKSNVNTLTAEKKTLQVELQVSQASVESLKSAIKTQNDAVAVLKQDADKRELAHKAEIATAKTLAQTYKAQAAKLLSTSLPPNANACNAANELINSEIQNAK